MVSIVMKTALFMGFGAFFVLTGALMVVFWPPIFFSQLKKMMILTNESMSFEMWHETPLPMYLEFYMFNISNVDDILARKAAKIEVQEMGPYVFKEKHIKANITWNDNSTVTFYNQRWWEWMPEMSNGSLSDNITSVNPVIVTVAYMMRESNPLIHISIEVMLRIYHNNMFLTSNVTSWLFDGIEDELLNAAQHIPGISQLIPFDKFAWFYQRNGSMEYDGVFVMNTGATDFSELGNVELWRNSNTTHYQGECGAVRGSTGELWAPELGQEEIYVFAPDVCTYLTLSKNETMTVQGVEGVTYAMNSSAFDNGYNYPHTACYCDEVRDHNCLPPGALNVSSCQHGAPAFVSLPHFLYSDPYYPSKIEGLRPSENYTFKVTLEMFTGMPLAVSAQLQINLLVRYVGGITINNELPDSDTLVPMFWFRQEVQMTEEYASQARMALFLRFGLPYAFYAITVVGLILLLVGIVLLVRKLIKSSETQPIIESSEEDNQ